MTILATRMIEVPDFGQFELTVRNVERLNLDIQATIWAYHLSHKYDTRIRRGGWEQNYREITRRTQWKKIGGLTWKTAIAKVILDSLVTKTSTEQEPPWVSFSLWNGRYYRVEEVLWWHRQEELFGGRE